MNDELLIEIVGLWPMLYDRSDPKYKDSASQNAVWQVIAAVLKETGPAVKTRWFEILNSYKQSWYRSLKHEYSELLFFLDVSPYLFERVDCDHAVSPRVDALFAGIASSLKSLPRSSADKAKVEIRKVVHKYSNRMRDEGNYNPVANSNRSRTLAPVDAYLFGLASNLEALSPLYFCSAKYEIFRVIRDCEKEMFTVEPTVNPKPGCSMQKESSMDLVST